MKVMGKHSDIAKDLLKSDKEEVVHANLMVLLDGDDYDKLK